MVDFEKWGDGGAAPAAAAGVPPFIAKHFAAEEIGPEKDGDKPGSTTWRLKCPWSAPGAADWPSWVTRYADGGLNFGCQHNSCSGRTWDDLLELKEPLAVASEAEVRKCNRLAKKFNDGENLSLGGWARRVVLAMHGCKNIVALLLDPRCDVSVGVFGDDDGGTAWTLTPRGQPRFYAERLVEGAPSAKSDTFITNEEGKILATSYANIRLGLLNLGARFSFNEFSNQEIVDGVEGFGPAIDDTVITFLHERLQKDCGFLPPYQQLEKAVTNLCREERFHPVKDYLAGLRWDGTDRISTWLQTYAGVENTKYARAVGRLFLLAAVRRVRQPGCRFGKMLILEGGQGKGKSTLLRTLMPREDWFSDEVPLASASRELVEGTQGKWLLEEAELSTFGHAQVERLKATITRQTDRARMAYARKPVDVPRQFILAGSTNEEKYLEDRTGNIRFWPVKTSGRLDCEGIRAVRDMLWAEAAVCEARGESIDLGEESWDDAREEQAARETVEPWEDLLGQELPDSDGKVLPEEIYIFLGYDLAKDWDRRMALRLGKVMRRLGWRSVVQRFGGVSKRCWCRGDGSLLTMQAEVTAEGRERHLVASKEAVC